LPQSEIQVLPSTNLTQGPSDLHNIPQHQSLQPLYTPTAGPILGPTLYTPSAKTSGPRHYTPVDSEPEESVHHIHHHYKPRPTQRPRGVETYRPTDKGFLGHGKEFDKLTGAALIVGGTGILGGILGQQLGGK